MAGTLEPIIRPDAYAQARLAAIVDSSFDAIISKDLNSVITSWNPAAVHLFGYSAGEAIGQSVLMLIPQHLRAEETDIIARIRRGERVESYETVRRRKDGSLVDVSLTISPIKDGEGGIVGASKIARDISAAKEDRRRITLLMREVNHRVKNQFAVILSMVRETVRRSNDPAAVETHIRERIMALSRSQDLLVASEWAGAKLADLVHVHLEPFGRDDRILASGPAITLSPGAVQHLGMALHELATNAAKYGALAGDDGAIEILWEIVDEGDRRSLLIHWNEAFTPPPDRQVEVRNGFGSVVLRRVAPQALDASAVFERSPGRIRWSLQAPLETTAEH